MFDQRTEHYNSDYLEWKRWRNTFSCDESLAAYFAGEFRGVDLVDTKVFEIGFGPGHFMAWARKMGAQVSGCELIPELVAEGKNRSFDTRLGSFNDLVESGLERFDLIVAIDVLEHVAEDRIEDTLDAIAQLLAPGGHFFARFPNGQSPFGLAWQHGDASHICTLSIKKMEQYSRRSRLRIVRSGNAFRYSSPGRFGFRDRLRYCIRHGFEKLVCDIYKLENTSLDPNVSVLMRSEWEGQAVDERVI